MDVLSTYEQTLLTGWEDVYKKAQLTLWILLALKAAPAPMAGIKDFIFEKTNGTISADDKSMYRALRRFADAELVSSTALPSANGPDKKIYQLTAIGKQVLQAFIDRNISRVFFDPSVKQLLG